MQTTCARCKKFTEYQTYTVNGMSDMIPTDAHGEYICEDCLMILKDSQPEKLGAMKIDHFMLVKATKKMLELLIEAEDLLRNNHSAEAQEWCAEYDSFRGRNTDEPV